MAKDRTLEREKMGWSGFGQGEPGVWGMGGAAGPEIGWDMDGAIVGDMGWAKGED